MGCMHGKAIFVNVSLVLFTLFQLNEFRGFMGLNRMYSRSLCASPRVADNHR